MAKSGVIIKIAKAIVHFFAFLISVGVWIGIILVWLIAQKCSKNTEN